MNKAKFKILEKAFAASVDAAISEDPCFELIQSKSKYVQELIDEGLLVYSHAVLPGKLPVKISGYAITERGIFEYSQHC